MLSASIDSRLREDVRLLGEILGRTIREQAGDELFELVERVRAIAKSARTGNPAESPRAVGHAGAAVRREHVACWRAPSATFSASRTSPSSITRPGSGVWRCATVKASPTRALFERNAARLLAAGVSKETLYETVCRLNIGLVLTAHPTEVTRRTLTQKYQRIAKALATRDRDDLTPEETRLASNTLVREVIAVWKTDEIRRERPTPWDEARTGVVLFEQVLWDAVPAYLRNLDEALFESTGKRLPLEATPVQFGSWMGGDRDGNPNVTATVTKEVCLQWRQQAVEFYRREVDELRRELSMHRCDARVRALAGSAHEPYRHVLGADARPSCAHLACHRCEAKGRAIHGRRRVYAFGDSLPSRCFVFTTRFSNAVTARSPMAGCSMCCGAWLALG